MTSSSTPGSTLHRSPMAWPLRLLAGLAVALCGVPAMAEATWADLPGVLMLGVLASAYLYARTALWWLLGLTAVAWGVRLYVGQRDASAGEHTGRSRRGSVPSGALSPMPVVHLVLTGLSVLCVALVLVGQSMGFRYEALREARRAAAPPAPTALRPQDFPSAADKASFKSQMKTWRKHSPNAMPWPGQSEHKALNIPGMPVEATGGQASINMVNASAAPVYVKLCEPGAAKCRGLRHVFIDHDRAFTLKDVAPGDYELRYLDLSREAAARSRVITVPQARGLAATLTIAGQPVKGQGDFSDMALAGF